MPPKILWKNFTEWDVTLSYSGPRYDRAKFRGVTLLGENIKRRWPINRRRCVGADRVEMQISRGFSMALMNKESRGHAPCASNEMEYRREERRKDLVGKPSFIKHWPPFLSPLFLLCRNLGAFMYAYTFALIRTCACREWVTPEKARNRILRTKVDGAPAMHYSTRSFVRASCRICYVFSRTFSSFSLLPPMATVR